MALAAVAAIVILLVAAQLILPRIAADQVRDTLAARGHVKSVSVSAFPAIKLLWHRADRVKVRMADLRADVSQSGTLLAQTRDTARLDVRADSVTIGPLTVHDVTVTKRDGRLSGSATTTQAELSAALPPGFSVQPVASGGGVLVLRATASLLGIGVTANAALQAQQGRLIIQPLVPLGGLVALTVFSDPHVDVLGVGAAQTADGAYRFTASATVH